MEPILATVLERPLDPGPLLVWADMLEDEGRAVEAAWLRWWQTDLPNLAPDPTAARWSNPVVQERRIASALVVDRLLSARFCDEGSSLCIRDPDLRHTSFRCMRLVSLRWLGLSGGVRTSDIPNVPGRYALIVLSRAFRYPPGLSYIADTYLEGAEQLQKSAVRHVSKLKPWLAPARLAQLKARKIARHASSELAEIVLRRLGHGERDVLRAPGEGEGQLLPGLHGDAQGEAHEQGAEQTQQGGEGEGDVREAD